MDMVEDRATFRAGRAATIARALDLARRYTGTRAGDRVSPGALDRVSAELVSRLLPHLDSDARLAVAVPGTRGASLQSQLAAQRRELGSLVEELDRVLLDAVRRPRRVERATGILQAVVLLLERHLVTERELWDSLDAAPGPEEAFSTLWREAEATERLAERSLRFVWHPPVAPTEAESLWWTSPKTRQVVVLDATGASGVRDAYDAGRDGTEAR